MNNRLSIYYAFLATSDDVDWLDCLRRAKAAGLDGLEMSAPKVRALPPEVREDLAGEAARLGLTLTFATALTPETDVSHENPAIRAAGIQRLQEDILMVSAMGGTALGGILTGVGKHFPPGIEGEREPVVRRAAQALGEAAETARTCGISLCLEAVNRFESPLVNTCAEALSAVEMAGSPALGVLLDTFHMNMEEADPPGAIRHAGQRLLHFHACENDRSLPGHGHIPWRAIFRALRDAGYGGVIALETLPGPYGSVAGRMNIWRALSRDVDEELAEAVGFLRREMEAVEHD